MGLYSNVPTFTYVSATGITVTYNEQIYPVQSFYTNKKYIYWDSDNATMLQASNTMPTRSFKRHLVLINDNGVVKEVPSTHEGFEISYSGDSTETIKAKIYALYENNKEFGDKFVAIEQDIDGIRQIVGSGSAGNVNEIVNKVSKLEQTAEKLELSVEEIEKIYADDKEMNLLREELNSSLINLNSDLGTFSSDINDYYKDDKISSEEKVKIDTAIEIIVNRKSELLGHVDKVKLICESQGENDNLIALNSGISALEIAHNNLINNINVAIGDSIIVPTEKTVIINAFSKYNLRVNELKNVCDEIIFLGVGGTLLERLAQISIKSDEIKLSVNRVESNFTSDLNLQKTEIEGQIKDVSSSLEVFKNTVETTFKDGIVDEAEKKVLMEKLEQLEKEKLDVDTKYNDIYSDVNLIEPYKTDLKDKYDIYVSKHEELKSEVLEVLEAENVTDADMIIIRTKFSNYSSSLAVLNSYFNTSLEVIATGKANTEILKVKDEILKELEDTNSKVDDIVNNIDEYIGDGIVDSTEKKTIETSLQSLEKEKSDIEAQFNYWYSSEYLKEPLKSEYKRVYDGYIQKYNNSVEVISSMINKEGLLSDKDRENMLNAHRDLTEAIVEFVEKSNEVISHVSLNQAEDVKNTMQEEIDDINDRLDNLDITIDETFADNIIDQAERKVLAQNISDLELQKTDVSNQYQQLYISTYLDGDLKQEFRNTYNNFITKYTSLIDAINLVLDKVELINDSDRELVSNCQSNLNIAFGEFVKKANEVIEYISKKQSDENLKDFNSELKDLNDRVDGILDDVGGALSDDVLDKAERIVLENGLNDLEIQKNDVVTQYENIFNNENLTDESIKENLKNSYDDFILKYNVLVNKIKYLLDKSGNITEENRTEYNSAYAEYKESVSLFSDSFYAANDYITNKVIDNLKDSFNNEIADLNEAISELDNTMNGIFKDGVLSEAEKISIREQLFVLEREKQDIDTNHTSVYSNTSLSQSLKTSLKQHYDSYISSYNQLINVINSILNKEGIISTSEQLAYRNALNGYRSALTTYSSTLRSAIDNITANKIETSKNELKKEIDDVIASIEDLENNMEEILKDGVLTDTEKAALKQHLYILYKEKQDIDSQYITLYENSLLADTDSTKAKSELKKAYDDFAKVYEELVLVIDEILEKTTIIDSDDRERLEVALVNYRNAIGEYSAKSMKAIDFIAGQKAESESEKVNQKYAEILLSEDGIVNRVGNIEKTSTNTSEELENLKERVSEAELSIKPDAIISTVKQSVTDIVNKSVTNNLIHNSSVLSNLVGFEILGGDIRRYDSLEDVEVEEDIPTVDTSIPSEPQKPEITPPPDGNIEEDEEVEEEVVVKPPTVVPKPVKTRIHFILTVECGDCILIETDCGKNILIDAPDSRLINSSTYKDSTTPIMNYLDKVGITKLDYIICTHFHSDHAGALPTIMNKYCNKNSKLIYNNISDSVINSISNEVSWKTTTYKANVLNKASLLGMTSNSPNNNTTFTLDNNTRFKIYKTSATSGFYNYNKSSLVVVFEYKNTRVALTGDITTDVQEELKNAIGKCDIVKDPHHGYNSSISSNFIKITDPNDVILTRNHGFGSGSSRACNSIGMWQAYDKNIYALWHTNDHITVDFISNGYTISTSKRFYFENSWMRFEDNNNLWYYFKQGGKYAKNETLVLDGKRYHFGSNGVCINPYSPE